MPGLERAAAHVPRFISTWRNSRKCIGVLNKKPNSTIKVPYNYRMKTLLISNPSIKESVLGPPYPTFSKEIRSQNICDSFSQKFWKFLTGRKEWLRLESLTFNQLLICIYIPLFSLLTLHYFGCFLAGWRVNLWNKYMFFYSFIFPSAFDRLHCHLERSNDKRVGSPSLALLRWQWNLSKELGKIKLCGKTPSQFTLLSTILCPTLFYRGRIYRKIEVRLHF